MNEILRIIEGARREVHRDYWSDYVTGCILVMVDGSQWFHSYRGGMPVKLKDADQ